MRRFRRGPRRAARQGRQRRTSERMHWLVLCAPYRSLLPTRSRWCLTREETESPWVNEAPRECGTARVAVCGRGRGCGRGCGPPPTSQVLPDTPQSTSTSPGLWDCVLQYYCCQGRRCTLTPPPSQSPVARTSSIYRHRSFASRLSHPPRATDRGRQQPVGASYSSQACQIRPIWGARRSTRVFRTVAAGVFRTVAAGDEAGKISR